MAVEPSQNPVKIVGITGEAGVGKDTVAGILSARYGFHRITLADGVRSALIDLGAPTGAFLKEVESYRKGLQTLGTEAREAACAPDVWVDLLLTKITYATVYHPKPRHRFVIPDVSYPHEDQALRRFAEEFQGCVYELWRVNRPDVERIKEQHSSEEGRRTLEHDREVSNVGTVEDLWAEVGRCHAGMVQRHFGQGTEADE